MMFIYNVFSTISKQSPLTTIITKQFSCLKSSLWMTTFVGDWTRLIHYTFSRLNAISDL
jgi:hypothetical protein